MKTVASSTSYYTRLLEKLNEQESSIERLQRDPRPGGSTCRTIVGERYSSDEPTD